MREMKVSNGGMERGGGRSAGKRAHQHLWMVEDTVKSDGAKKSYWTKVGVAFENRDGSWSLELSALPVSGRLQMREPWVDREPSA